jgi:hypothetical protein
MQFTEFQGYLMETSTFRQVFPMHTVGFRTIPISPFHRQASRGSLDAILSGIAQPDEMAGE